MDRSIEEKFVKNFIVKDKRERILYELNSPKKRSEAIRHICFSAYDDRYMVFEDSKISYDELLSVVKKYINMEKDCYVISDSGDDGKLLPFKVAFANMLESEMSYVIICGENIALFGTEYEVPDTPCRFILRKN